MNGIPRQGTNRNTRMTHFRHILLLLFVMLSYACADKENVIPVSDTGEGTKCDADMTTAETCLACSRLPQDIAVQLTDCCTEDKAFHFCSICTKNTDACLEEAFSVEEANIDDDSGEYGVGSDDYNKRFGTTFMGSSRFGKRFGRLFFGRGGGSYIYGGKKKRYGKIGMGSGGFLFKRSGDEDSVDKRYGSLNIGGSRGFLYKRAPEMDKRFGRLGMGKYTGFLYKRQNEEKDKRFGRLFMSGKRYGSLFLGG